MEHSPDTTDPFKVSLSDEKVREFQKLLKEERGLDVSLEQARGIAVRTIRLYRLVMDPDGYEAALWRHDLVPMCFPPPPPPTPEPRPCPIRQEADHADQLRRDLIMLEDELRTVKRWPNNWRWALVAIYDALGHALALHCQPEKWPAEGLGQLTAMFDVVASLRSDLPSVREAVVTIDHLRTNFLTYPVNRWPVDLQALPDIVEACQRVARTSVIS